MTHLLTFSLAMTIMAMPGMSLAASPSPDLSAHPAQVESSKQEALPSPPADASVTLRGNSISIHYNAPMMRGRKIMGGLVPYGRVWRTGANPATSLKTTADLKIGGSTVPAGSYTLYTLPSEDTWMLIINKQTGQWGTEYDASKDLVRVKMKKSVLPQPQQKMSISFEDTNGNSTELHVRWETTDVSVPVVSP